MYLIKGKLQNYAWGIVDGLSPWRQEPAADFATGEHEAELWFGAHPNGPSEIVGSDNGATLASRVKENQVPILVKLLAAAKPLSLQIHPNKHLAADLLAKQASDPNAPQLLSDAEAKTEMLVALTDFSALLGLRDSALAAQLIDGLGVEGTVAADQLRADEITAAIRTLVGASDEAVAAAESELVQRMTAAGCDEPAIQAMRTVIENYPGDSGILVAALLEHHQLVPGDALYAQAGIVHAYVSGIGVEVMVASDNVFRLGLTPKTIAMDEALAALDVDLESVTMSPPEEAIGESGIGRVYAPAGSPFEVRSVESGAVTMDSGAYRLVLVTRGSATVSTSTDSLTVNQGEAVVVTADEPAVLVEAPGQTFIAQGVSN